LTNLLGGGPDCKAGERLDSDLGNYVFKAFSAHLDDNELHTKKN
jgi:hypothetical protein